MTDEKTTYHLVAYHGGAAHVQAVIKADDDGDAVKQANHHVVHAPADTYRLVEVVHREVPIEAPTTKKAR